MGRGHGSNRAHPRRRWRDTTELRLLGVVLIVVGLVLLFLCIPGWAWAALMGAAMVAAGFWLVTLGAR